MKARTWIATLSGATLVVTTAVFLGGAAGSASADTPYTNSGAPQPVGVVTLQTTSASNNAVVTYTSAAGVTSATTQTLSAPKNSCALQSTVSPSGAYPFLDFTPSATASGAFVSYLKKGIGVGSSTNSSGTACGQVNTLGSESLTIALDPNSTSYATTLGRAQGLSANFDVNLSGNAVIQAVFKLRGTPVGGAELQSGFSAPQQLANVDDQLEICKYNTSNSGPQSGYNNNCFWQVRPLSYSPDSGGVSNPKGDGGGAYSSTAVAGPVVWDSVTLTPLVGDFSVQGGASYPAGIGGPTSFSLTNSDGTLDCGTNNIAARPGGTGTLSDVTIWRLGNGDTNQTCDALPYTLDNSGTVATFHKPLIVGTSDQSTAQFYSKMSRHFTAPVSNPVPAVQIDWEDNTGPHDVPFCAPNVITTFDPSSNYLPTVSWSAVQAQVDQSPVTPNLLQYACVYAQSSSVSSDGSVDTVDWVYFTGDMRLGT